MRYGAGMNSAPSRFNPQAALHLGVINFRTSSTPIGCDAFGLCFEDATYELNAPTMRAFHASVISAMRDGKTAGIFRGSVWEYIGAASCHESDSL